MPTLTINYSAADGQRVYNACLLRFSNTPPLANETPQDYVKRVLIIPNLKGVVATIERKQQQASIQAQLTPVTEVVVT